MVKRYLIIPYMLFFASGLCALVYEVVWSRMLVLIMGNTTLATSTILSSFMAGLFLGSYYWGRYIESRPGRALAVFAGLEVGVGLLAIIFPWMIRCIAPLEAWTSQLGDPGHQAQVIIRFLFCFLLLLAPTFLMGGTFAVMGRQVIRNPKNFGRDTALLYGINTAGALIGAFLAGFFLIRYFGHNGSLWLAASLNFVVGATAFFMHRGLLKSRVPATPCKMDLWEGETEEQKPSGIATHMVIIGLTLSGFCAMAYQVLWTRLLILIIDNSIYSFTIILMAFLAGISLGSMGAAPLFRKVKDLVVLFAFIEIAIAVSAFCFPFFINLKPKDPHESYILFLFFTLPAGILLPTVLMGAAFPVAARVFQLRSGTVGETLGSVYAANTFGGALGALAGSFLFIGCLGFQKSALILPGVNLAIAALIISLQLRKKRFYAVMVLIVLLAVAGIRVMTPDYFEKKYSELEPKSKLLYYKEALATTAAIFQRPNKTRVLYLNGIPEVDTRLSSVKTFKLMGALPGLLHDNPQNGLMVTFGAGVTAGMTAHFVKRMDCVDLAAQAGEIASHFAPFNDRIHEADKFSIHIDDARHFLQSCRDSYSIIVSDATHPRVYDSWVLFTTEFYRLTKEKLEQDGIFLQWVPFHGLNLQQFMGIVRTFSDVFPHTSIWRVGQAYALLLATPDALKINFRAFYKRMSQKDVWQSLRMVGLDNPFALLTCFAMSEEGVKKMVAPFPRILTDNSPAHLFFPFGSTFKDQYETWPGVNCQKILENERSIRPFLTHISNSKAQAARIMDKFRYYESIKDRL